MPDLSSPAQDTHSEGGAAYPSEGELFKRVMGADWLKLHPDIQRRFDKSPSPGAPLLYQGQLSELHCSWFGRLLGWLTMALIRGALIPFCARNVPVDISVYCKPKCRDVFKQRHYRIAGRKPIQFTSFMREGKNGEVFQHVGAGLGMKLLLSVDGSDLHFRSDGYFWDVLGRRIALPDLLTPGKTLLWHRNDHPGQFNIRIEIRHPLFGLSFTQVGVFEESPAFADQALHTAAVPSPAKIIHANRPTLATLE